MRTCRYQSDGGSAYGFIEGGRVYELDENIFASLMDYPPASYSQQHANLIGEIDDVTLLAPITPSKIICVGRNYAAHAEELGNTPPKEPLLFFKPPSAIVDPYGAIEILSEMGRVEHEAELAVVIGRQTRHVTEEDAHSAIFGYTCANDVSDRDFQKRDELWTRAKGYDTFCPLGPWIDTTLDISNVRIICHVNGEARQDASTQDMVFKVPELIAYISRIMTLEPGDLILTGTPSGVSPIEPGDTVRVTVEGIGTVENPVVGVDI